MDLLPLVLATATRQIKAIRIVRVIDVSKRRIQLQRKAGVGLSPTGFQQAAIAGAVGHVGLRESALMIADTFGWKLEDLSETLEPVMARERTKTDFFSVDRGYALGLTQTTRGLISGQEVIRLDFRMSLGARDAHDTIEIDGQPPIKVTIPGGIHGDTATASIIANCVPAMARSRQTGLLSMRDLPLSTYYRPRDDRRED
jgi:4-hydroxy-tetrahydrodipicolinate reductase